MIKFFRKIRQKMLLENKISKYLLYAIGEIVLVVIGILIALQINNKNENEKLVQKEIEILQLFQESLTTDLVRFKTVSLFYKNSKKSIERVLKHLENNLPYEDTLASDFFNTTITYEQSSFIDGPFETLKSSGLELISNTTLRLKIVDVYDNWDLSMETSEKRYVELIMNTGLNIYKTRFDEFWRGTENDFGISGVMHPTDYNSLRNDKEYLFFLKTQLNLMGWFLEKSNREATVNGTLLKDLIEKELKEID
ncbi:MULTISPECIES: DUF6090 family protein [unclassified Polaribacter]|uniref:DUF6090 family protein n=1 Tax=unclassified Polaribacter TaxID=196858 RepID=UPI0011BF6798|nr:MULTISPECIES: DUF6090 family protein [unclassified Polaribacter]TXD49572.1 hypothetical protein ES043_17150 [Polaribacter sp. IC063]TXD58260.1 hypothetical protein ES044_12585 [Polaribacter sp. IC066]